MKFLNYLDGMIINPAHIAYAERWPSGVRLHLAIPVNDPDPSVEILAEARTHGHDLILIPAGPPADAIWAALSRLAEDVTMQPQS
jgi:hypothetical protein